MRSTSIFLGCLLAAGTSAAAPLTVYQNNFDTPAVFAAGVTGSLTTAGSQNSITGVQGYAADGFSGNLLYNYSTGNPATATVLSLANLPAHNSLDIDFLLALINTWDSNNGSVAPDYFNVRVDGTVVLQLTAANKTGTNTYAGTQLGTLSQRFGGVTADLDRAFDMTPEAALLVTHTASSATIEFFASGAGWQGTSDEAWGIENLKVTVNTTGVPEPGTLALLGLGLAGLAATRRRKQ